MFFGIKKDRIIYHYTITNGLTSNNIQKIKADKNTLWIALDNSIQVFDFYTKHFKTLTKRDGVVSYDISGIEILNNKVFLSSNQGLFSLDKEKSFKRQDPNVYFNQLEVNEKDTIIASNYKLEYNQNAVKIGFNVTGFLFNQKGKYRYRLKGFNNNWLTTDVGVNSVKYNSLPAGKYIFQVQPVLDNATDKNKIIALGFFNKKTILGNLVVSVRYRGTSFREYYFVFQKKNKNKRKGTNFSIRKNIPRERAYSY